MIRTQIYINNTEVDLLDDISIPMTYSILDIREPEKRTGAFSKTITIPGSQANNKLFSHIWDVATVLNTSGVTTQYSPNFNPNLKASALVLIDGQEVLKGSVQLLNVNISEQFNYGVEYEICIFADINDLIQAVGDKMLSDLDLSEYDHTLSLTNQILSWGTSIKKNGGNYTNFSGGQPIGEGYVYPMIDYGFNNGTSYNVTEFFPAIYAKTIFDKICGDAGFQIAGQFDYSSYFKHLVVPFSGTQLRLSDSQISNRTFKASNNSQTYLAHDTTGASGYNVSGAESFQDDSTGANYDPGNVYNTSTFKFTASTAGTYKIATSLDLSLTHFPTTASVTYSAQDRYVQMGTVQIYVTPTVGQPYVLNSVTLGMLQGASSTPTQNSQYWFSFKQATLTSGTTNCSLTVPLQGQVALAAGDTVYIKYAGIYNDTSGSGGYMFTNLNLTTAYDLYKATGGSRGYTRVNLNTGSWFQVTLADTKVQEGDMVTMSNVLPTNIKQKDFLLSVIKAHNLYVLSDKLIPNKLIIDDRNAFYSSGTTRDWSGKLDYSKERRLIPMGELDARDYLFTYKDDSDYYNDRYKKKWNETYAQKRYSITNDFLKEEVKTELIFSPTPIADYLSGIDRIIPQIYTLDNQGVPQPKNANIRLLYYGGVFSTADIWSYVSTSGTTTYSTYPYAGMVDIPTAPTVSLDWEDPHEVYYTTQAYTDNNLFNKYWKQQLDEITDADSKIFEGWFRLLPSDIANLDFRDQFYFEGQYWRLNKIYDYNPIIDDVTKCEFIKLKEHGAFVASSVTGYGGVDNPNMPVSSQRVGQGGNTYSSSGLNNFVAGTSQSTCRILGGSNNTIGEGCTAVNILSSSGVTVSSGLQNVSVLNSSGVTITQSNTIIVGNTRVGNRTITVTTTYYCLGDEILVRGDATSPPPAGFKIYLPQNPFEGQTINVKKVDSTANYVYVYPYTGLIDGAANQSLVSQYENLTLRYYAGNWDVI